MFLPYFLKDNLLVSDTALNPLGNESTENECDIGAEIDTDAGSTIDGEEDSSSGQQRSLDALRHAYLQSFEYEFMVLFRAVSFSFHRYCFVLETEAWCAHRCAHSGFGAYRGSSGHWID